ncbi:MAG: tRNA epoxyqueuosine(34) reductase QueG [Bacteroidales bacterium]|nr:tRNA epoxyqueuosine(34) reductase QueG [Bacteroidales bacterium]MBN2756379.1 tRNA epoxyqueuosine(34) reductase QueG [Bacteroidales bacterium]
MLIFLFFFTKNFNKALIIKHINKIELSKKIKSEAKSLGFLECGISKVEFLKSEEKYLKNYLENGFHGKMKYLENHFEKRLNPSLLVDNAKSVISVLLNYYTDEKQIDNEAPIISKYAFAQDYHQIIKEKLQQLLDFIKSETEIKNARAFVDSAPVLDKTWAVKSGLGWIGKNGNLINKNHGSFFFIGELIVDIELEYDKEIKEYCGTCTKCIDACPTNAIVAPKIINGSKCISYLTIELKDEISDEFIGKLENRLFGCDICQDVCPFNKKSKQHNEEKLKPILALLEMTKSDWQNIDNELFNSIFKKSAIKRAGFKKIKSTLKFLDEKL